jgi:hypothetical protein
MRSDSRSFHCRIAQEASDRWRLFTVAAQQRGKAQAADSYAARLRERRAMAHVHPRGRGAQLQVTRELD